jgi:hypothetical protein
VMGITEGKHGGMSSPAYILLILLGTTWLILYIVLETQGKLGVMMLAMHDINKYISSTCSYSSYSFMIEFSFEFCW